MHETVSNQCFMLILIVLITIEVALATGDFSLHTSKAMQKIDRNKL